MTKGFGYGVRFEGLDDVEVDYLRRFFGSGGNVSLFRAL